MSSQTGQSHTGQSHTGQPHTGQPHTGQPHTGQPHTGQPHTGQLQIETGSRVPPFEQLRGRLSEQVRDGSLAPGTRLPTVRGLAADLGVARVRRLGVDEQDAVALVRSAFGTPLP